LDKQVRWKQKSVLLKLKLTFLSLSSRPIHVFILEGANAIKRWLDFVGPTDPEEAKKASPER
jgi:nucleoside diphosphate kinase